MKTSLFVVVIYFIYTSQVMSQIQAGGGHPDIGIKLLNQLLEAKKINQNIIESMNDHWKECTVSNFQAKELSEIIVQIKLIKTNLEKTDLPLSDCNECISKEEKKLKCLRKYSLHESNKEFMSGIGTMMQNFKAHSISTEVLQNLSMYYRELIDD